MLSQQRTIDKIAGSSSNQEARPEHEQQSPRWLRHSSPPRLRLTPALLRTVQFTDGGWGQLICKKLCRWIRSTVPWRSRLIKQAQSAPVGSMASDHTALPSTSKREQEAHLGKVGSCAFCKCLNPNWSLQAGFILSTSIARAFAVGSCVRSAFSSRYRHPSALERVHNRGRLL